ncbi:cyclin-dependent protein kinase regulator Pho80 [Aspergillus bombycis]|uniref:Cyclin-dependent protein kinase regulator Pho80 n=1 Tax=Aspergillus bombycis TaxID=109264 RepID=A0A1F7ZXK0_9EURO|nr:cyclin-dependent protein kinase regulator Pho80 [Aspergillus bombycis]OGM44184.1 cyclin-dependent protein kinase regulator Pho80 [Aspergillus bombycis]
MLVSSPSPSSALRPSPSSPPTRPPPSLSSPPLSRHSSTTISHNQHYEPVGNPTAAPGSHFSPHSSRVAIEELRSALNRHTVASSPPGPSGDLPRGRMSAGLTSLGGGNSTAASTAESAAAAAAAAAHTNTNPSSAPCYTYNNGPPAVNQAQASAPAPTQPPVAASMPAPNSNGAGSNKRNSPNDPVANGGLASGIGSTDLEGSQSKRLRPSNPTVKLLPARYELADPRDIVVLISSMLMELIRFNDKIPLHQGRLTRFHSRSPPRISVNDYLQRLTTHATLSPPILLSMVYYIDRLCALYPAFTVSSLTIHRFLIASATVASKGLSDSFWTNKTYARVGGISMTELALLELEFLFRVEWRIVPQPEVLEDYYQSLVERCEGYEIQREP